MPELMLGFSLLELDPLWYSRLQAAAVTALVLALAFRFYHRRQWRLYEAQTLDSDSKEGFALRWRKERQAHGETKQKLQRAEQSAARVVRRESAVQAEEDRQRANAAELAERRAALEQSEAAVQERSRNIEALESRAAELEQQLEKAAHERERLEAAAEGRRESLDAKSEELRQAAIEKQELERRLTEARTAAGRAEEAVQAAQSSERDARQRADDLLEALRSGVLSLLLELFASAAKAEERELDQAKADLDRLRDLLDGSPEPRLRKGLTRAHLAEAMEAATRCWVALIVAAKRRSRRIVDEASTRHANRTGELGSRLRELTAENAQLSERIEHAEAAAQSAREAAELGKVGLFFKVGSEGRERMRSEIRPDVWPQLAARTQKLIAEGAADAACEELLQFAGTTVDSPCYEAAARAAVALPASFIAAQAARLTAAIPPGVLTDEVRAGMARLNSFLSLVSAGIAQTRSFELLIKLEDVREKLLSLLPRESSLEVIGCYLADPQRFGALDDPAFFYEALMLLRAETAACLTALSPTLIDELLLPLEPGDLAATFDELPREYPLLLGALFLAQPEKYAQRLGEPRILRHLVAALPPECCAALAVELRGRPTEQALCIAGHPVIREALAALEAALAEEHGWSPDSPEYFMERRREIAEEYEVEDEARGGDLFALARERLTRTIKCLPPVLWRELLEAALPQRDRPAAVEPASVDLIGSLVFWDVSVDGMKAGGWDDYSMAHLAMLVGLTHPIYGFKSAGGKKRPGREDPFGNVLHRWNLSRGGNDGSKGARQTLILDRASRLSSAITNA